MYMLEVIAFFLAGRFNVIRKMPPERSVKIHSSPISLVRWLHVA